MPAELPGSLPRLRSVPAFILCGGAGTRLRGVESRPKAIVPVAGTPFLSYVLRLLRLQGFRRMHLLLGIGAEAVRAAFAGPGVTGSLEEEPLGTGGALARARRRASRLNLILNGDSYAEAIYPDLLREHLRLCSQTPGALTILACREEECGDYGALEIDGAGRVTAFAVKGVSGPGWINAGVYAAGPEFFRALPEGSFSLERDVLPGLAREGKLHAFCRRFFFRDIGTPERLALAQREFRWIRNRIADESSDDSASRKELEDILRFGDTRK